MKYALNLAKDGRILSTTYEKYATIGATIVESFPEGDLYEYRYVDGEYIHDPIPVETAVEEPSQLDIIEAQVAYTAMMTDTLLEV